MISEHDLLYPITPEQFGLSERRFIKRSPAGVVNGIKASETTGHTGNEEDVTAFMKQVDALAVSDFHSYVPSFSFPSLTRDLNLAEAVGYLLRPRFTPGFQLNVLNNMPIDLETVVFRQEGVRELVAKPEVAKGLEDSLDLFHSLACSIFDRGFMNFGLSRQYNLKFRQYMRAINPFNVTVIQRFLAMVENFDKTLEGVESGPLQRLRTYVRELKESEFYRDVFQVFDVRFHRNFTISLDVDVDRDGSFAKAEYQGIEERSPIPGLQLLTGAYGRARALLEMWTLPSTFAMNATNAVVEKNLDTILKMAEVVGPIEFYTGMAGYHRRMEDLGMPVKFPRLLGKEERKMRLDGARNPLLLYQEGEDPRNIGRVVPNDIEHNPESNFLIITGPNQNGKSVYVKTLGLNAIFGQNGGPVIAEGDPYMSIVEGLYLHFLEGDDMMKGAGTLRAELIRIRDRVLPHITPFSIAILDEPTAGTDLQGSVGEANKIFERIHRMGAAAYVTTHFRELADSVRDDFLYCGRNLMADVRVDPESGRPIRTYKIVPGIATSSYAHEIAREVGLSEADMDASIEQRVVSGQLDTRFFRRKGVS